MSGPWVGAATKRLNEMKTLSLFLLFLLTASFVEAQEISQKKPKTIFYDVEGKPASLDKINADLTTYIRTHILNETKYGSDSTVYRIIKKPRRMFVEDSLANAKRIDALNAMVGKPAKNFTLIDLNNKKIELSQLKGKVVVINFWFSQCSPCIEEIPELNILTSMYNKSKVSFLAITYDNADTVRSFQKNHGFKFQILTDAKKVTEDYRIIEYPTTLVIDKYGIIRLAINNDKNVRSIIKGAIDNLN